MTSLARVDVDQALICPQQVTLRFLKSAYTSEPGIDLWYGEVYIYIVLVPPGTTAVDLATTLYW